jgi:hypothetical protein
VTIAPGPLAETKGPAATPSLHGLVPAAQLVTEPNDRWVLGFTWDPETCAIISVLDPSCAGDAIDWPDASTYAACVNTLPVLLEVVYQGPSTGYSARDWPGLPRRQLEAGTTKALEYEFWTGTKVPTNQHLASAQTIVLNSSSTPVTGMTLSRGLAALERAIADCGVGGRGTIHAPVDVVSMWTYLGGPLKEDGQRLVTVAKGTVVVAGAGYPGTSPTGAAPPPGMRWIYATGAVQVRLSAPEVSPDDIAEGLDRKTNQLTYRAFRNGAANFDPCCGPFAVLVDLGAPS